MAIKQRIGLRQVRALQPGKTIWDPSISGFGARRQKGDAVTYVLFYRTKEGRQRWFTIGRHGAPWTPETAEKRPSASSAKWPTMPILPSRSAPSAMLRRSRNYLMHISPMPQLAAY